MSDALNTGLALLVLALAVWTVVAPTIFAAVVGFIAYGLLLSLVWVRLDGIDIALTEAAIGGGLSGALLIGAKARLHATEAAAQAARAGTATRLLGALFAAALTAVLMVCVLVWPEPAPTLAPQVAATLAATGVGNPVTAVLLAFRAIDTLLEAIVLVLALIGVWSLAPDLAWGGRPGSAPRADPNGMLAYTARLLVPVGIVIGGYIFWVGADHPGGKFQGATILAAMWLLVIMAGLADTPQIGRRALRIALVAGPLVFIGVGLFGSLAAGALFAYPQGWAKPLIIAIELALLPTLTLILALLLVGAPMRRAAP
jgi:multisubunit Na+/H+ antiporter MnhB subunit